MSAITLLCEERDRLPLRQHLEVRPRQVVQVWVLERTAPRSSKLRSVVLRTRGSDEPIEDPACDATNSLVLEVRGDAGTPARLRVVKRHGGFEVRRIKNERETQVLAEEDEIPPGAIFEVEVKQRKVRFSLATEPARPRGLAAAVGALGYHRSYGDDLVTPAGWRVPSFTTILASPKEVVAGWTAKAGAVYGEWRTSILMFLPYAMLGGLGALGYVTLKGDNDEAAEIEALKAELAQARGAVVAGAAIDGANATARKEIAARLQDTEAAAAAAAAKALDAGRSARTARMRGGRALTDPAVEPIDVRRRAALEAAIAKALAVPAAPPILKEFEPCTQQASVLGDDLSPYVLVWSADPARTCPADQTRIDGVVEQVGRWGMSDRAAFAFGGPSDALDPRVEDALAARIYVAGLRDVRMALLTSPTGGRPAVAPSEADAWALTLWHAYNRLPSGPIPLEDPPAATCVAGLLDQLVAAAPCAEVGEPVLPPLGEVASGDKKLDVRPVAGCSWPADAMRAGAEATLRALVLQARLPEPVVTEPVIPG